MRPVYLILLLTLITLSCGNNKASSHKPDTLAVSKSQQVEAVKPQNDTTLIVADTTQKLLGYKVAHIFSDSVKKDVFSITLYGKNILNGVVVFAISNYRNQQLFKETYPSSDLLGDLDDATDKQKEDTISNRMSTFLDTSNFNTPAVGPQEKIEESMDNADKNDKKNWNDIKADRTAVSFTYTHGYEGVYGIAYSKKRKKVVSIFYSD